MLKEIFKNSVIFSKIPTNTIKILFFNNLVRNKDNSSNYVRCLTVGCHVWLSSNLSLLPIPIVLAPLRALYQNPIRKSLSSFEYLSQKKLL